MELSELKQRLSQLVSEPSMVAYLVSFTRPGQSISPTTVAIAQQFSDAIRPAATPSADRAPTDRAASGWQPGPKNRRAADHRMWAAAPILQDR